MIDEVCDEQRHEARISVLEAQVRLISITLKGVVGVIFVAIVGYFFGR